MEEQLKYLYFLVLLWIYIATNLKVTYVFVFCFHYCGILATHIKSVFWTCYNCYKGNTCINSSNNFIPAPPFLFYSSLLRISAYADMGQLSLSIAEAEAQVWEIPNFEYWFTGIKSTNFSSVDSFTKFCTELRLQSVHH